MADAWIQGDVEVSEDIIRSSMKFYSPASEAEAIDGLASMMAEAWAKSHRPWKSNRVSARQRSKINPDYLNQAACGGLEDREAEIEIPEESQ